MAGSKRAGMGAVPFDGGVTFRVWAKFATAVYVEGTFNSWSTYATPLAHEGNGYWSGDVAAIIGDSYRYVIVNGNKTFSKKDPYSRSLTPDSSATLITDPESDWQGDSFEMPPWNELVIYEIHVGTFNDDIGGAVGQLSSIEHRLGYLHDLGINCIQLMPIMEFAADVSWGYNVANPFAVEVAYGGPAMLKRLVREAHKLGIGVILDVVFNHWGPENLDLWQFDGWSDGGNGGIYFYNDDRRHTPWGETRPDYGRPEVRQFLRDNALMWFEECHVDGLRFDSTVCIRREQGLCGGGCCGDDIPEGWSLMQWINDEIGERYFRKLTIAEDMQGDEWLVIDTGNGGAGMGAQWSPQFVHGLRASLIEPSDESREMRRVVAALLQRYTSDAFKRVIYTESHDEVANGRSRLPHEIDRGNPGSYFAKKRTILGAAAMFTTPGIPMLFQGQELLEDEWFRDTDPIDWTKLERFAGVHAMFRDLIRLRRNCFNNTRGLRGQHIHVFHINDWDKVIVFHRWDARGPGDDVIVVLNFSSTAFPAYRIGFPREGTWYVRFNSDAPVYDKDFGAVNSYDPVAVLGRTDDLVYGGDVGIGPYSALILSQ
jgi:1,4-alpha-glucan branching enzyme